MEDGALELFRKRWRPGAVPWTREDTGENGVVLSSPLPDQRDLADLLVRLWKKQLRLWWSAWTDGLRVMEPRLWWGTKQNFHVWCVSSSAEPLEELNHEDARLDEDCMLTVAQMHRRKLANGFLEFFKGDKGPEIAPSLNLALLIMSFDSRVWFDKKFFEAWYSKELERQLPSRLANDLSATLSAETLSFYEILYPCHVEKEEGTRSEKRQIVLRLFTDSPHPGVGVIKRPPASVFFLSMLKELKGEQLSLVLNDSPDPFETSGIVVAVTREHPTDENCLIVEVDDSQGFKFTEGWCRASDIGTADLIRKKRRTLSRAVLKRHIQRWMDLDTISTRRRVSRDSLPEAILMNEGVYCVQGPQAPERLT